MNKIAIALLLGTVFAVGCGDKTDAATSGSTKASSASSAAKSAATSAAPATTSAAPATSESAAAGGDDADKTGLAECDAYIKAWKKCYKDADAAMKGPLEVAYKAQVDGWKKSIEAAKDSEPTKKAIADGCKKTADAFKCTMPKK